MSRTPDVERLKRVKGLFLDVDGVFTDAGLTVLEAGESAHTFHIRDGLAMVEAAAVDFPVAIISGRRSAQVARRLRELRVHTIFQGVADKPAVMKKQCEKWGLTPEDCAFMGDDVNDVVALSLVGLAAAPSDARPEVRALVERKNGWVVPYAGGKGAVRELVQAVLMAHGKWPWNVPE